MLRYLASGSKDLHAGPVLATTRFNWEFYANLSGSLRPVLPNRRTSYAAVPTLWLFPPTTVHGWEAPAAVERVVMHFSSVPDLVRDACAAEGYLAYRLSETDLATLHAVIKALDGHYRNPSPESILHFQRALIDLSLIVLQGQELSTQLPLEAVAVERVERALEWYGTRLDQRPTLTEVAAAVHVSPAHLRRQFRRVHGRSPLAVFTQIRLEKAAQLLATTSSKLEVVARNSGFGSASDLCRVFHRCFGVYPHVWRTYLSGIEQEDRDKQLQRLLARSGPQAARLSADNQPEEPTKKPASSRGAPAKAGAEPARRKRSVG